MNIEQIAKLCHEVNRIYCLSIGDESQVSWEDAPDWQQQSVRRGVMFHMLNPEFGPSDSHENWLAEKFADGWRYGEVKNVDEKTHPCCVPYENLPLEHRMKDEFFVAVVKGCLK